MEKNKSLSKTSVVARFRWWYWNKTTTVKTEHTCSFSAVVGWCWQRTNRPRFVVVALKTRGYVKTDKPPLKTSMLARFRLWLGGGTGTGGGGNPSRVSNEGVVC